MRCDVGISIPVRNPTVSDLQHARRFPSLIHMHQTCLSHMCLEFCIGAMRCACHLGVPKFLNICALRSCSVPTWATMAVARVPQAHFCQAVIRVETAAEHNMLTHGVQSYAMLFDAQWGRGFQSSIEWRPHPDPRPQILLTLTKCLTSTISSCLLA